MKLGGQAKTWEEMWIVFGFGALGGRDADAGTGADRSSLAFDDLLFSESYTANLGKIESLTHCFL